jgi:hypothetical protein
VSCAQSLIAGRCYRERSGRARRTAPMRTVKSCGPGTRCWCQVSRRFWRPDRAREAFNPRGDGDKKELVAGESTKDPVKTIAQGRPDDPGYTCGSYRVLSCCTRAMGAAGTRPSLRPRYFGGTRSWHQLGARANVACEGCAVSGWAEWGRRQAFPGLKTCGKSIVCDLFDCAGLRLRCRNGASVADVY